MPCSHGRWRTLMGRTVVVGTQHIPVKKTPTAQERQRALKEAAARQAHAAAPALRSTPKPPQKLSPQMIEQVQLMHDQAAAYLDTQHILWENDLKLLEEALHVCAEMYRKLLAGKAAPSLGQAIFESLFMTL